MPLKLGDAVSFVATPIARALHLDCIDPETNDLRAESPCAKAKQQLNMGVPLWSVFYDRFFSSNNNNEKETMETNKIQFVITVAVEAESVEEALQKKNEGKTLSVNPRPTPPAMRPGVAPSLTRPQ